MNKCQDSIRADRFSDSNEGEVLQILTAGLNAGAISIVGEIIGQKRLRLNRA
ncbi:MAG: hypothetical protein JSW23_11565 [Planctomycetota bacterium]|nr:MAG: hypothetical protein JSW23_11565 [Planctomycetota bacterium]